MEFKQLRAFVALADTLSFSRAAQSLFISQSTLSRQIADLEEILETKLFVRSSRSVELTAAGESFLPWAKDLVDRQTKMMMEFHYQVEASRRAGSLRVGTDVRALVSPIFRRKVTDAICSLRDTYPGIRITVQTYEYKELVNGLREGHLDCAFMMDRDMVLPSDIESYHLGQEEMQLVFRAKTKRTPEEIKAVISERGLLLVESDHRALYHILHMMEQMDVKPQIAFCPSLNDAILNILVGESATILPQSYVEKENNPNLQTLFFPGNISTLKLNLLWKQDCDNPMVSNLLQNILEQGAPEDS